MIYLQEAWSLFRSNVLSILMLFSLSDVLDILVVAYLFYQLMRLVRETRAMQLIKGILAVLGLYVFATLAGMNTLGFFIQSIVASGIVMISVIFQPEIRRALEQLGRTKLSSLGRYGADSAEARLRQTQEMIEALCAAAAYLSSYKTGALVVLERQTKLGEILNTGTVVDSKPSMELISNLFFHNAPLHDGAVVIRDGRLAAAGCFLPLSGNMEIGRELGTRHRAALGMSEVSDAVVVVVSEETGAISVAMNSRLQRGLTSTALHQILVAAMLGESAEEAPPKSTPFWRIKK